MSTSAPNAPRTEITIIPVHPASLDPVLQVSLLSSPVAPLGDLLGIAETSLFATPLAADADGAGLAQDIPTSAPWRSEASAYQFPAAVEGPPAIDENWTNPWSTVINPLQMRTDLVAAATQAGSTGPRQPLERNSGAATELPSLVAFQDIAQHNAAADTRRMRSPVTTAEVPTWANLASPFPQQLAAEVELSRAQLPESFWNYSQAMTAFQSENLEHIRLDSQDAAGASTAHSHHVLEPTNAASTQRRWRFWPRNMWNLS